MFGKGSLTLLTKNARLPSHLAARHEQLHVVRAVAARRTDRRLDCGAHACASVDHRLYCHRLYSRSRCAWLAERGSVARYADLRRHLPRARRVRARPPARPPMGAARSLAPPVGTCGEPAIVLRDVCAATLFRYGAARG